jgi:maltose alpha-D-glucosyltransferase / alpha-amylase
VSSAPADGSQVGRPGVDAPSLAAIAGWLPRQRWFAGKQHTLRSVAADAAVPITMGGSRESDLVTVLAVRASFADAPDQRYALPVAVVSMRRSGLTPDDRRTIALLDDDRLLVDAMALPDTAAIVIGVAFTGATFEAGGATVRGRPLRPRLAAHPMLVRPLSVEQSNTSVLVGSSLMAKLVRRVEPGRNPDAELTAHLAANGFPHVPGLAATLELALPGGDPPTDVLMVHDAIANDGDVWSVLVERLGHAIADGTGFDDRQIPLARLLGRRTAELHAALAAPGAARRASGGIDDGTAQRMRPEPFTLEWQRLLVHSARSSMRTTQAELAAAAVAPGATGAMERARAAGLLDHDPEVLLARFARLEEQRVDSVRIRVHGDLHLGQILATGDDIVFIDFEGEPGIPIDQRLVKRSPLVDVAGLLRSIDYLGRHVLRLAKVAGTVPAGAHDRLDHQRDVWTHRLSDALVAEYFDAIGPAHLVPSDRADAELLLDLYVLDKGLYEIRYELANRPDWVGGPLAAVTEMITR